MPSLKAPFETSRSGSCSNIKAKIELDDFLKKSHHAPAVGDFASRPGVSAQPGNPCKADFRISAVSRSAMTASVCCDLPNILAAFEVHHPRKPAFEDAPRTPRAPG